MNNDLISREALKEKAETVTLWNGEVRRFVSYETIDNAPTVEPKKGKWKTRKDDWFAGGGYAKCTNCKMKFSFGAYFEPEDFKFCPECGANMGVVRKW